MVCPVMSVINVNCSCPFIGTLWWYMMATFLNSFLVLLPHNAISKMIPKTRIDSAIISTHPKQSTFNSISFITSFLELEELF